MNNTGHSANIIEQNLYVFGGYDGDTRFNSLWQVQNITSIRKCVTRICLLTQRTGTNGDDLKWERGKNWARTSTQTDVMYA